MRGDSKFKGILYSFPKGDSMKLRVIYGMAQRTLHRHWKAPKCMRGISTNNIKDRLTENLDTKTRELRSQLELAESLPFDKYWEDIMRTDKDPDYRFDLDRTPFKSLSDIEAESKRLLDGALKGSDTSDLQKRLNGFITADFYQKLDLEGREIFLKVLAREYGPDHAAVLVKSEALNNAKLKNEKSITRLEQELRHALQPLFLEFFTQLYQHPGGMRFIVKMREDLLTIASKNHNNDPHLRHMGDLLKSKMFDWFGISFLDLERITWSTPAEVLEKIIKYEAVHAIPSWQALKERLLPGRACFAFFHKAMPMEPLAFVHVSFEKNIQRNVQAILDNLPSTRVDDASVAVFYTISSPQKGLAGIDLGNLLIKRVVKDIQSKSPQITTFTTLSPIPGFRNWLETQMNLEIDDKASGPGSLLLPEEVKSLRAFLEIDVGHDVELLKLLIHDDLWMQNESVAKCLEPVLMRLCSRYILLEKKRTYALDPVANFHIRNGACVYQLNWLGDTSDKGLTQSYGMMINYLYDLPHLDVNHVKYSQEGVITVQDADGQFGWAISESLGRKQGKKGSVRVLPLGASAKL